MPSLLDQFGRVATDLRLSVTDRCSLRCTLLHAGRGCRADPAAGLLTGTELVRLVRVAVGSLGVRRVRITGGEPLVRRDLEAIVEAVAAFAPRPGIAMTTNAVGPAGRAAALADAGLDRSRSRWTPSRTPG